MSAPDRDRGFLPSDPVRCPGCGWSGIADDMWTEDGAMCPTCGREGLDDFHVSKDSTPVFAAARCAPTPTSIRGYHVFVLPDGAVIAGPIGMLGESAYLLPTVWQHEPKLVGKLAAGWTPTEWVVAEPAQAARTFGRRQMIPLSKAPSPVWSAP